MIGVEIAQKRRINVYLEIAKIFRFFNNSKLFEPIPTLAY